MEQSQSLSHKFRCVMLFMQISSLIGVSSLLSYLSIKITDKIFHSFRESLLKQDCQPLFDPSHKFLLVVPKFSLVGLLDFLVTIKFCSLNFSDDLCCTCSFQMTGQRFSLLSCLFYSWHGRKVMECLISMCYWQLKCSRPSVC